MTDITKCTGLRDREICPRRKTCYRFTAPSSSWQSWMQEAPLYRLSDNGTLKCDEYWSNESAGERHE